MSDHADTIRRDYGANLPDAAHLLISVLEWGGVKELLGADLHGRAHQAVGALLGERQQLEATLGLAGKIEYDPEPTVHLSAALYDRYVDLCKEHLAERQQAQEERDNLAAALADQRIPIAEALQECRDQRRQAIDALREARKQAEPREWETPGHSMNEWTKREPLLRIIDAALVKLRRAKEDD